MNKDWGNMKILVVGLGSIGRRHLQNLAALGVRQLAAVTQNRCPLPSEVLPPHLPFQHLDAALAWRPDAVFVCNPTALHLETARAAARAGCHLFLEKPVSNTVEGLDELARIAAQQRLVVQVGFQFRFHPVLRQIKPIIDRGGIGRIVSAQAHWGEYLPDWHPWEDYRTGYSARADLGGGVLLTLCHPFDYLRWILGEPTVAGAVGGHLSGLEMDTEDTALVTLRFAGGAIGSVYLDYISKPPQHTLQIVGDQGRIEWEGAAGQARVFSNGGGIESLSPGPSVERNELFLAEVESFLNCIRQSQTPQCTLHDGIRALELALRSKNLLRAMHPSVSSGLHGFHTVPAIW